jgi:hypothetical protein
LSLTIQAEDIEVVVEPKEPIINETFFVTFKVKTSGSEEPYISFTPNGASVLGKRSQGLSISTIVINGKVTTTKEQAVVYELMAERSGQVYLRNIKVEISGKVTSVKDVNINVLNEARRVPDVFLEAEASKTKVYIGEGIDVNYFLYYKLPVANYDVKEFPKLNKFIKRFHHMNSPAETVQYKGQVYKRILAYSARIYPEKVGSAVVDSLKTTVQVVENDYNNGFGFGSQRYKTRDLSSPRIDVEVLALPSEGVPSSFTGLIGEHDFILSIPKTKYLVNEPIELKLEVKGKGAVENFDAPIIFSDNNLEQFDTKSEVSEINNQSAKKLFEYTLLARGPVKIPARELALAYFEPSSGRYIEKKISVPALEVSGVAAATASSTDSKTETPAGASAPEQNNFLNSLFTGSKDNSVTKNQVGLVGPNLSGQGRWFDRWFLVVNGVVSLLIVLIGVQWYLSSRKSLPSGDHYQLIKRDIAYLKKKGLNYPELYRVLAALDKTNKMASGGISIINIIDESTLQKDSKDYFKKALDSTEGGAYAQSKSGGKGLSFEKKHFRELMKNV